MNHKEQEFSKERPEGRGRLRAGGVEDLEISRMSRRGPGTILFIKKEG